MEKSIFNTSEMSIGETYTILESLITKGLWLSFFSFIQYTPLTYYYG
jgi:hypothetical protein